MVPQPRTLIGLGIGLAAASAATAAGVAAGVVTRRRHEAYAALTPRGAYAHTPDRELAVLTDDGVPLYVEVDEPAPDLADPARPTVVLSHGYCLSLQSWVLQRRALIAAGYRVVTWDQRGHGRSEQGSEDSCTIDQLGRDLFAVIQATAPEGPLALIGHSMGGMTVMALAEERPEFVRDRVVAAGFVATSAGGGRLVSLGFGELAGRIISRLGPQVLDRLGARQAFVARARRLGREFEDFLVARYSFASPVPPAAVRFTADMIFSTPLSVMADFLPTFELHNRSKALAAFDGIETLVFNGDKDILTPPDHSEEIVRLLPGAEHVLVADAGHIILLEHPELLTEQLLLLIERGQRTAEAHAAPRARSRRVVTDMAKRRRVAAARREKRRGA